MSLINDALKRAKAAQTTAPQPEEGIPHLRPVESAPAGGSGSGLLLPIALTLVALSGLFFLWHAAPGNTQAANPANPPSNPLAVAARSPAAPSVAEDPGRGATHPDPGATTTAGATGVSAQAPALAVAAVHTNTAAPGAVVPVTTAGAMTNLAASAAPAVTSPVQPRLQAIFYSRSRPSAMIGGKTVRVGDRVAGFQVAAITPQSATLVGAGTTNLLSLEP